MKKLQLWLAALIALIVSAVPSMAQMADGTNSVNSLFGIVDYGSNKGSAIVLGFIGFAIAVGLVVWVGRKSGFKAR